jgi:hypothetical protein
MIAKQKRKLRKVCRNYEQVENYEKAIADEERWELHHRREIEENKSRQQLIDEGNYYDVDPSELIFLTRCEHNKLHHKDKFVSDETRKKLSENHANVSGENNPMYGRKGETAPAFGRTGDKHPMYGMCGEKNPAFGKRWWNDGKRNIFSKDCPGPNFVRGIIKLRKR